QAALFERFRKWVFRLANDLAKDIGDIRTLVVETDRWSMPADEDDRTRLLDRIRHKDRRFERRRTHGRVCYERVRAALPAVEIARHKFANVRRVHVARDNQQRVIRNVVAVLD